jgi:hypothetical protein
MEEKTDNTDKQVSKQMDILSWICGGLLALLFLIEFFGG